MFIGFAKAMGDEFELNRTKNGQGTEKYWKWQENEKSGNVTVCME